MKLVFVDNMSLSRNERLRVLLKVLGGLDRYDLIEEQDFLLVLEERDSLQIDADAA